MKWRANITCSALVEFQVKFELESSHKKQTSSEDAAIKISKKASFE